MPIYRPQLASKCCIMPKMHSGNGRQIILCAVNMVYVLHVCIAPVGSMDHLSCQIRLAYKLLPSNEPNHRKKFIIECDTALLLNAQLYFITSMLGYLTTAPLFLSSDLPVFNQR